MKHFLPLSAYFLAILLGFTGIDKLFHYHGFVNALSSYAVVVEGVAVYLAPSVILAELWVALGLILKPWRRVAALMAAALLGVFTIALVVNYFHAPGSVCGCWFTFTLAQTTETHVLQNLVFIGLALTVWHGERQEGNSQRNFAELPASS